MNLLLTLKEVTLVIVVIIGIVVAFYITVIGLRLTIIKPKRKKRKKNKYQDEVDYDINENSSVISDIHLIDFIPALAKSHFYTKRNIVKNDIYMWQNVKLELEANKEIKIDYVIRTKKSIIILEVKDSTGYDDIENTQIISNEYYSKKHKKDFIDSCTNIRKKFIEKFDLPKEVLVSFNVIFTNNKVDIAGLATMASDGINIVKPRNKQELTLSLNDQYEIAVKHDIGSKGKNLVLFFDHKLKSEAKTLEVTKILNKK